jgi:hypothetical protein
MKYSHTYDVEKFINNEEAMIDLFEKEAADYLRGTDSDDVGGVIIYTVAGDEVAFFDYEVGVGSVYELTGLHSWETEMDFE